MLVAGLFYLVSCYFSLRVPAGGSPRLGWGVVLAGLAFRLTVWPLAPGLSDDPYRYRWEGKLQAAGGNPYQARPADPEWAGLRDSAYPRVVGKDFKAVYGPLTEQIELWTWRVVARFEPDAERQVFWFKLPFALLDLGVIAALWLLLRARGLPPARLVIYAWSPLVVVEFWATGHNDSLAVLFLVLALAAAARSRWTWAFAALSLAAAAKVWPLLLFPLFVGWEHGRPRRWHQWWVAAPILAALAWPYWSNVDENLRFLSGFMGGWRNNDSLFGLILWVAGDIYRAKKAAFGICAAVVAWLLFRERRLEHAVLAAIVVMLMVASNSHPWYLTWILPLLALLPSPALLLWTALAPLAHAAVIPWAALGEWQGSTGLRWYIYLPVYAMLAGTWCAAKFHAVAGWAARAAQRGWKRSSISTW